MIYLDGAGAIAVRALALPQFGFMAQPGTAGLDRPGEWPCWAADNGCFAQGARFDIARFLAWLDRLRPHLPTCLFAVAPDVYADWSATLARFASGARAIRALGYRVALVTQNGLRLAEIPWHEVDVLFIGGSDAHKRSQLVVEAVREARARGKPAHMGRVNSLRRLVSARAIGCASADGTFAKFAPTGNAARMRRWLAWLDAQPLLTGFVA